ncbi:glycerate kinase [Agromyces rhizosphaerae]|uniref:Glycerate kinase n=1 Tax=Agromyces rhizosphaerae TaxID=88374 RepID=A0A9W6FNB4_9MICO|nr:glycerate kinase [Agromyces rhizosphaerae]GLI26250.1 glycerate kinase [Agromyces rhizosphaerae]
MSRRVVLAPDSFKGTATAADAASALAAGWARTAPGDELVARPMADGGEGTIDALAAADPDAERMPVRVTGPDGRPVDTSWLRLTGADGERLGVVELASASGITLLDPLQPLDAHTIGFGEAIAAALDAGVDRLLLAIGGSSSTDGGLGALTALGARATDASGRPVRPGNRGLGDLHRVDLTGLRPLPPGGAVVLSDVTNPLLGADGAAAVFGPQKGADEAQVPLMDAHLARFAAVLRRGFEAADAPGPAPDPATPGAGAAGGTGYGLLAWGATAVSGAAAVAEAIGLAAAIDRADVVVTGEGKFDGQSEAGKVPSEVRATALASGVPVALVAGVIAAEAGDFAASVSLADLAGSPGEAMARPLAWLEEAGARLAALLPTP